VAFLAEVVDLNEKSLGFLLLGTCEVEQTLSVELGLAQVHPRFMIVREVAQGFNSLIRLYVLFILSGKVVLEARSRLIELPCLHVKFRKLMQGYRLLVFYSLCSLCAFDCLVMFLHLFIAVAQGRPHT